MSLPFMKLGTLAVRTISKPIANRLKKHAAVSPKFRTAIIGIAQANHRLTTTIQRRIYGRATDVEIRPLNEERAVQVAGVALIYEVQRNARSEAKKEEIRKQEIESLWQRDEEVARQVELLKKKINELDQHIAKAKTLAGSQAKNAK